MAKRRRRKAAAPKAAVHHHRVSRRKFKFCRKCKHTLPLEHRRCHKCGRRLMTISHAA